MTAAESETHPKSISMLRNDASGDGRLRRASSAGGRAGVCDGTRMSARPVKLLGELALRVNDLGTMLAFYRDVVGLAVWREYPDCVFLRIADGVEGHPQALVLFDRAVEVGAERSTIDHFAFVIGLEDYDERRRELERLGLQVQPKKFPLFHWRSLFVSDPEGNTVEFVCYDPSV
jgi:catechol-2,3-dioxygenase